MEICYDKGCNDVWVAINKCIHLVNKQWSGGNTSTNCFFLYLNPGQTGIWKCWFLRGGENRSTPRKTSRSKGGNQQQTQPTYLHRHQDLKAGHISVRRVLSQLRHPLFRNEMAPLPISDVVYAQTIGRHWPWKPLSSHLKNLNKRFSCPFMY